MSLSFKPVATARESWAPRLSLPRHRHRTGYLCLVLSGGIDEAGDRGRRIAHAGDVNCHGPFDAHRDWFLGVGAQTINFALPDWMEPTHSFGQVQDPDLIARTAESDHDAARQLLLATLAPVQCKALDWPDQLAADIRCDPHLGLTDWAENHGLAPASVSRGFRRVYEISPNAYRAQVRAHYAWQRLVETGLPFASIAVDSAFADQAHMTRAVIKLTGRRPSQWRHLGKVDSRHSLAASSGLGHEKTPPSVLQRSDPSLHRPGHSCGPGRGR